MTPGEEANLYKSNRPRWVKEFGAPRWGRLIPDLLAKGDNYTVMLMWRHSANDLRAEILRTADQATKDVLWAITDADGKEALRRVAEKTSRQNGGASKAVRYEQI